MTPQIVILAAGMGTRLGKSQPKSLTLLANGRTILQQQLGNISGAFGDNAHPTIVVGYKREKIRDLFPHLDYIYNDQYQRTNTSKSLLAALRKTQLGGVLWMNGDVVFEKGILQDTLEILKQDQSFVVVKRGVTAAEEIKFSLDIDGNISSLSKSLENGAGEAVGINYVSAAEKSNLIERLKEVSDADYFERAMELTIQLDGTKYIPIDVGEKYAIEVDFPSDLIDANNAITMAEQ